MLIDLTIPFHQRPANIGDPMPYELTYITPRQAFAGLPAQNIDQRFFPDGEAWAVESFDHLSTHAGTHVDFPYHFGSARGEKPTITSDDIPFGSLKDLAAVCLDFSHKSAGSLITLGEVQEALVRSVSFIRPGGAVLVRTGASDHYDEPGYWTRHAGVSGEATRWLIETFQTRLVGIDAWGWDQPFDTMTERALANNDFDSFWQAHKVGREFPYCQMENLAHLDRLPPHGFRVSCMPIPIAHASAAWANVWAEID